MLTHIAREEENGSLTDQDALRRQEAVMAVYLGTSFMLQQQFWNAKLTQKMERLRGQWYRWNGIGG